MSGMYDMKPVRLSKRSSYVKFTDEMEQAMSSQRHLHLLRAPIILTYGSNETPEFQRQNRDFAAAVKAAGKPAELVEAANFNHFEMNETLANPYGPNGRAARADEAFGGVAIGMSSQAPDNGPAFGRPDDRLRRQTRDP
jgi:arylformamidase